MKFIGYYTVGGKDGDGYQWPASNHGITIDH